MTLTTSRDTLFSPIAINSMILRNRIVMPSMVTNFAAVNGEVTEKLINYHAERAKGGCGLNILEATYVHINGNSYLRGVGIDDDSKLPGLRRLTQAIHMHGGKAAVQLQHGGRTAQPSSSGHPILLVSYIPGVTPYEGSRVMDEDDVMLVVKSYREAAERAVRAGFDAIELHGAHGYLLSQFMSPYTNRREDQYGGSFENRMRLPLQVLREVREEAGPDYPILFRLSVDEFLPAGIDLALGQEIAKSLVEGGVDAVNVSVGAPETNHYVIPPSNIRQGWNADRALAIREAVNARVPVCVVGRINDRATAEDILSSGKADLVAMGRALIADPYLPAKLFSGMDETLMPCVACNEGCAGGLSRGESVSCAVNPQAGQEGRYPYVKAASAKRVVVVGAGPAGMQAALTAAQRGHSVTLLEERGKLGGLLNVAALPPHKEPYAALALAFETALRQNKVDIRLGEKATPELIQKLAPDVVILAAGSKPVVPCFCAGEGVAAQDVLLGAETGKNVLVIGGGLVGSETAEFLSVQGKEVTILELREDIALDMEIRSRRFLLPRLRELAVKTLVGTELLEIMPGGKVKVKNTFGLESEIGPFDTMVLAVGYHSNNELAPLLSELGVKFIQAGDCLRPGKVMHAIQQGMRAAYDL